MSTYQIVELQLDGSTIARPQFGQFTDGKLAARQANLLGVAYNKKFQVRPVEDTQDWRDRERKRMHDGTYKPLVWADRVKLIEDHFAHIDPTNPNQVEFTPDERYGKVDRKFNYTVNRYLSNYYSVGMHDRKIIAKIHAGLNEDDDDYQLKFATTASEIETVYLNGPDSCMAGNISGCDDHPTSVYAAGDLAVAYLEDLDGDIVARGLCWPDKKIYGRLYGADDELGARLQKLGYLYDNMGFQGARLKYVWTEGYDEDDDHFEGPLAPYLDVVYNARHQGDYLILDVDGEYHLQSTSGAGYHRDSDQYFMCKCGRTSHNPTSRGNDGKLICTQCAVTAGTVCAITGNFLHPTRRHCNLADGRKVQSGYADSHTFVCPQTGERWLKRDGIWHGNTLVSPNYKEQAA
jgi:hypothetical protein